LGFGLYLVALKETAVLIGICGPLKRESMHDVEIGFAFLERFWAKGYAYKSAAGDGLRAKLTGAEADCGDNGIRESWIHSRAGKLGLRFERTFRLQDRTEKPVCMLSKVHKDHRRDLPGFACTWKKASGLKA
jgi:hypothetical protein